MGGNELPSNDELEGFRSQLEQLSPSEFQVRVTDKGVEVWKDQLFAAVKSLEEAMNKAPTGPVDEGAVLHPAYESATVTAQHLRDSGESVRANIRATKEAAEALHDFVLRAYDLIDRQQSSISPRP